MTYKAFVESQQKSPGKRRRMISSSDAITQEVSRKGGMSPSSLNKDLICVTFLLPSLFPAIEFYFSGR